MVYIRIVRFSDRTSPFLVFPLAKVINQKQKVIFFGFQSTVLYSRDISFYNSLVFVVFGFFPSLAEVIDQKRRYKLILWIPIDGRSIAGLSAFLITFLFLFTSRNSRSEKKIPVISLGSNIAGLSAFLV
jgi:hypothetical protein